MEETKITTENYSKDFDLFYKKLQNLEEIRLSELEKYNKKEIRKY